MERWLYIAACVLVPGLWGAACAWMFRRRDRARGDRAHAAIESTPPSDG